MKRDVFDFEEQEEEFVADKQQKLIVDEALVQEYWKKRASLEAFKVGILTRINPFLAMRVFEYEPSISFLLADDKTAEQQLLWKRYFETIISKVPLNEKQLQQKIETSSIILAASPHLINEYQKVLLNVQKHQSGIEYGYRHLFMWTWLLCRLIARELASLANMETEQLSISANNFYLKSFLASQPFKFIREENANVMHPSHINILVKSIVSHKKREAKPYYESNTSNNFIGFDKILALFLQLPSDAQYIVFRQAAPILRFSIFRAIFMSIARDETLTVRNIPIDRTLLMDKFRKLQGSPFPGYLFEGPQTYTYEYYEQQLAIVTTTYPSNPDVGPGIFTGQAICSICSDTSNLQACGTCLTTLYCSSSCQEADWQSHALICGKPPLLDKDMDYLVDYITTKTGLRKLGESDADYKARMRSLINNMKSKERKVDETDEAYAKRIISNVKRALKAKQAKQQEEEKKVVAKQEAVNLLNGMFEMEDMSALFRTGAVTAAQIQEHVKNLILVEMEMMKGDQHGYIKEKGIYETIQHVLEKYEDSLSAGEELGKEVVVVYDLRRDNVYVSYDLRPRPYWVELWRK